MIVTTKANELESGQRLLVTETNEFDRALLGEIGIDLHDRPLHLRVLNSEGTDFTDPRKHFFLTCAEFRDLVIPVGNGEPQVIVK